MPDHPHGLRTDGLPQTVLVCNDDLVPDRPAELPSKRVAQDLRRRLSAGEWASGDQLPTVAALAAEYQVARRTVTKALKALEDEGLVHITPSWGTHRA